MVKEKGPLRQQFERGYEQGADPNKTPKEALHDTLQIAQQDMEAASNLVNARKERKAAVALRLNQLREESGLRQRGRCGKDRCECHYLIRLRGRPE